MSDRFGFLESHLAALKAGDSFRQLRAWPDEWLAVVNEGRDGLINFGSNDYLGLAEQRWEASSDYRRGAGASPLVSGYTELHARLCQSLIEWEGAEAAVVMSSGYAACSGVVAALPQAGDLILSDRLNHASLIDGCRLSKASTWVYPHADLAAVESHLVRHRARYERVWIVTDGVFGMDGELAPLAGLCDLAERHDAILIVDEAHGSGVLGHEGTGACEHCGVRSRVPIRIGTLSKAIGAQGGFVVGPRLVIDYLVNVCRPLIFSTAFSPMVAAVALEGIRVIRQEPWRRRRVQLLARQVRSHLVGGDQQQESACVPIIPVVLGSNERALEVAQQARSAGLFLPAIRPPTVPEGSSRLRISLSCAHQDDHIERLLAFLDRIPEIKGLGSGRG